VQKTEPLTAHKAVSFDPSLLADLTKTLKASGVVLGFSDKMEALNPVRQVRVLFHGIGGEPPPYDCLLAPQMARAKPDELEAQLTTAETL
jgi:hypothetical protein